ncbi:methyltransferase domain-containing protein [Bacillus sp. REN10]|uniref:class I SAM-dependent methyltransferase n=1 Tax=Bacillus sp. REN10 TaxID=2782541 RepID=UPI00193B9426|nr:methyltransferase domain-containing protein [Bacillus sp. REN10]
MTVIIDEKVEWTISGTSFFKTANVKAGEHVLYVGDDLSFLARLAVIKANVTNFPQLEDQTFDSALTSLSIHKVEETEELLQRIFAQLKPGGRLVADFAEAETLRYAGEFAYTKSLPDYWDLLCQIGFEAIFVQQITACTIEEVALQGWEELLTIKKFPVKVNRFVALKGCENTEQ